MDGTEYEVKAKESEDVPNRASGKRTKPYTVELKFDITITDIEAISVGSAMRKAEKLVRDKLDRIRVPGDVLYGGIIEDVLDDDGNSLGITQKDKEHLEYCAVNPCRLEEK